MHVSTGSWHIWSSSSERKACALEAREMCSNPTNYKNTDLTRSPNSLDNCPSGVLAWASCIGPQSSPEVSSNDYGSPYQRLIREKYGLLKLRSPTKKEKEISFLFSKTNAVVFSQGGTLELFLFYISVFTIRRTTTAYCTYSKNYLFHISQEIFPRQSTKEATAASCLRVLQ